MWLFQLTPYISLLKELNDKANNLGCFVHPVDLSHLHTYSTSFLTQVSIDHLATTNGQHAHHVGNHSRWSHNASLANVSESAEDLLQVARAKVMAKDGLQDTYENKHTAAWLADFKEDAAGKAKNGTKDAKEDLNHKVNITNFMKDGK